MHNCPECGSLLFIRPNDNTVICSQHTDAEKYDLLPAADKPRCNFRVIVERTVQLFSAQLSEARNRKYRDAYVMSDGYVLIDGCLLYDDDIITIYEKHLTTTGGKEIRHSIKKFFER